MAFSPYRRVGYDPITQHSLFSSPHSQTFCNISALAVRLDDISIRTLDIKKDPGIFVINEYFIRLGVEGSGLSVKSLLRSATRY